MSNVRKVRGVGWDISALGTGKRRGQNCVLFRGRRNGTHQWYARVNAQG
jgi:hypothetical protein